MNTNKRYLASGVLFLLLCYFSVVWIYKLEVLPGLHGDEAWFSFTETPTNALKDVLN